MHRTAILLLASFCLSTATETERKTEYYTDATSTDKVVMEHHHHVQQADTSMAASDHHHHHHHHHQMAKVESSTDSQDQLETSSSSAVHHDHHQPLKDKSLKDSRHQVPENESLLKEAGSHYQMQMDGSVSGSHSHHQMMKDGLMVDSHHQMQMDRSISDSPDRIVMSHDDMHKDHKDDMDGMDHHNMSGMGMMMYFHFGVKETVLFKDWKISTDWGMVASMVGIFIMGMLYEGLKYLREFLFKRYIASIQFSTVAITGEAGRVTQVHKVEKHRMLSLAHALQTALHIVQIVLSYFLMLIFMTYNAWLCIAVVLGAGFGYFVFGWRKASVVDITEHCH